MKIIVLESLLEQTSSKINDEIISNLCVKKSTLSAETIKSIYKEYEKLAMLEKKGNESIRQYFNSQNSKQMKNAEHIFKYRLNAGDRILFTYAKYLPNLSKEDKDSIVLLNYSKHDNQGLLAHNRNFQKYKKYKDVKEITELMNTLDIQKISNDGIAVEDLYAISDLLLESSNIDNYKKYVFNNSNICDIKDISKLEVSLSYEQGVCIDEYKNNPQPTLILGGAGSGKTLISIHLHKEFNHKTNNNIYFTQSNELRSKIREDYKNITWRNNLDTTKAIVENINDFCIEKLDLKHKNLILYNEFKQFIDNNKDFNKKLEKANISIQNAWAEIRGVIKGSMYSEITPAIKWQRVKYASQQDFNIANLSNYIKRSKDNKQIFCLNDTVDKINTKSLNDPELSLDDKNTIKNIIKYFATFNSNIKLLDYLTYKNLPEEESILEASSRELIYKICESYQKYCDENDYYDENDLARKMFEKMNEDQLPKFDCVIIDEIQDYTELQIYLIYKMCKNTNYLIMAGDSNQIINPTMFSVKRIKDLFFDSKNRKLGLKINFLSTNFRSQHEIINIANKLSSIRRTVIACKDKELEQDEKALNLNNNIKPFRFSFSKDNQIRFFLEEIFKYPSTVILVADKISKNNLIDLYGQEEYKNKKINKIFTVSEIKGMEYKYVVCFNLIGFYSEKWKSILNGLNSKKTTKYRYYFNLVYVAITRAREYLCFIDKEIVEPLEKEFALDYIKEFDKNKLYFNQLTSTEEDWLQEAKNYEKNGMYQEALSIYDEKLDPDLYQMEIYRCEAHVKEQEKDYEWAIQDYLLIGDADSINKLYKEIKDDNQDLYLLCNYLINIDSISYENNCSIDEINLLIEKVYKNKQEANKVKFYALKLINQYFNQILKEAI